MNRQSIDPGKFRHRLVLERETQTPDGCGGFTSDWELVVSLWLHLEPVSQSQISNIDTLNSQARHNITIRWRPDCKPEMRFRQGDRKFIIMSIFDPDETKRYLICNCEEAK